MHIAMDYLSYNFLVSETRYPYKAVRGSCALGSRNITSGVTKLTRGMLTKTRSVSDHLSRVIK